MSEVQTPREVTLQILNRVEEGAWASEVLHGILRRKKFDARDARFITELAYGTLRRRLELDHILAQFIRYKVHDLDRPVRNILRMGLYQLRYMRVPAYAACDRAVELARRAGCRRASGLVNGVLRNAARAGSDVEYPDRDADPVRWIAVTESHPVWVVRRWIEEYGVQEARRICRANNRPPSVNLRVNQRKISRSELLQRFAAAGMQADCGRWAPHALYWGSRGSPHALQEYEDGLFSVQGEGSQLAVAAAGAQPGMRVLEPCAGRGGKTTYLAEVMDDQGEITAVDLHEFKLDVLQRHCRRLGLRIVRTQQADARSLPLDGREFDLVFVDAPCSGSGIFRRHPDARWHRDEEIAERMQKLQGEILRAVARLVAPGGILVYCTCSLLASENEDVMDRFLQEQQEFCRDEFPGSFPAGIRQQSGTVKLLPHLHDTDGFFIARLRRSEGVGK